jgi:hypothetical protein
MFLSLRIHDILVWIRIRILLFSSLTLMIEGSRPGSGSIPLTNGSGSRRLKNTWIRWIRIRIRIRIRNTAAKFRNNLVRFFFDPTQAWTNYVRFPFAPAKTGLNLVRFASIFHCSGIRQVRFASPCKNFRLGTVRFASIFLISGITRVPFASIFPISGINRIRLAPLFLKCRISRVRFASIFTSSGISRFVSFRYRKRSQDRSFVPLSFRYRCHY